MIPTWESAGHSFFTKLMLEIRGGENMYKYIYIIILPIKFHVSLLKSFISHLIHFNGSFNTMQ